MLEPGGSHFGDHVVREQSVGGDRCVVEGLTVALRRERREEADVHRCPGRQHPHPFTECVAEPTRVHVDDRVPSDDPGERVVGDPERRQVTDVEVQLRERLSSFVDRGRRKVVANRREPEARQKVRDMPGPATQVSDKSPRCNLIGECGQPLADERLILKVAQEQFGVLLRYPVVASSNCVRHMLCLPRRVRHGQ